MELRHLRYFTAVVDAKGYRNASRRLHIAQPALSQTVADLEAELRVKLFVRSWSMSGLQYKAEPGSLPLCQARQEIIRVRHGDLLTP